jgi:hypothetical protein
MGMDRTGHALRLDRQCATIEFVGATPRLPEQSPNVSFEQARNSEIEFDDLIQALDCPLTELAKLDSHQVFSVMHDRAVHYEKFAGIAAKHGDSASSTGHVVQNGVSPASSLWRLRRPYPG